MNDNAANSSVSVYARSAECRVLTKTHAFLARERIKWAAVCVLAKFADVIV